MNKRPLAPVVTAPRRLIPPDDQVAASSRDHAILQESNNQRTMQLHKNKN